MLRFASPTPDAIPVWFVSAGTYERIKPSIGAEAVAFAEGCGFKPRPGGLQLLPAGDGRLAGALFGMEARNAPDPLATGKLAFAEPKPPTQRPPGAHDGEA